MAGKSLFCCASAMKDFKTIVSTLGGPGEVSRANELLACVTVVPSMVSPRTEHRLKLGGKIKQRSLAVFSTGDALSAVTVSANEGFIRSAKCQVIRVLCHHIVRGMDMNSCILFVNYVSVKTRMLLLWQILHSLCLDRNKNFFIKRLIIHFVLRTL
jgi:hypothetical protein